jgi:hypothetical protein
MRGRLIFPFLAEIARLDTAATAAVDPAGPPESGYDPDFKETVLEDAEGDGIGADVRKEMEPVFLPAQVEVQVFEALQQAFSGNIPDSDITLVFHFKDLERMGLVDSITGEPKIRPNDRLVAIHDRGGNLVQAVRTPPGLYVNEVKPAAFGLGHKRNLLLVSFHDREQGTRSVS